MQLTRRILVLLLLSVVSVRADSVPVPSAAAAVLYVDPSRGNDSNPGNTVELPFRSIEKARDHIREKHLNDNMQGEVVVLLRGGRYELKATLCFDSRDSGSNGNYVTYRAYPGEEPLLCGGRRVTDWKAVEGKPYYSAAVPERKAIPLQQGDYTRQTLADDGFAARFAQLYVNGVRAERARSHDVRKSSRKEWWNDPDTIELRDGIYLDRSLVKNYARPGDMRILYLELFKSLDAPVESIVPCDDDEIIIKMRQPHFNTGSSWHRILPGTGFFIVNALEELDEPGEWYLDQAADRVYYYPHKRDGDLNEAEVYAPRLEGILRVDGSPMLKVSHIRFEGITFQYGHWTAGLDTYLGFSQAEIFDNYHSELPGQVVIDNADHIEIQRCTVRHMGSCGIQLYEGAHHALIEGNLCYDTTGAGITVGRWWVHADNCPAESVCTNTVVRNNVVRNTGRDYWQGTGINIFTAYNCKVHHNDVSDTAYTAIHARIGGSGWVHPRIGLIEYKYNKVSHSFSGHKWGIGDGGNLYMHGPYPGSVVEENYSLYANRNVNREFYSDNFSHTVSWVRNVSRWSKAKTAYHAWHGGNRDVVFDGNYSERPLQSVGNAKLLNHKTVADGKWPEEALRIMENAGVQPNYRDLLLRTYGHVNLAQGQPCWSSSDRDGKHAAVAAGDGDWKSFWSAAAVPGQAGWWSVDLGAGYVLHRITLLPRQDAYEPQARRNLEVQASNDRDFKTYDVLANRDALPWYHKVSRSRASNMWEQFLDVGKAYRYLRVQSTEPGATLSLAEFAAYGHPAEPKALGLQP